MHIVSWKRLCWDFYFDFQGPTNLISVYNGRPYICALVWCLCVFLWGPFIFFTWFSLLHSPSPADSHCLFSLIFREFCWGVAFRRDYEMGSLTQIILIFGNFFLSNQNFIWVEFEIWILSNRKRIVLMELNRIYLRCVGHNEIFVILWCYHIHF